MPAININPPYPIFTESNGQPLENGYIYVGVANLEPQTNPINIYWDKGLTQLAAQPVRTSGGYPINNGIPARLYANSDFSIRVMDRKGTQVYYAPVVTDRISNLIFETALINTVDIVDAAVTTAKIANNAVSNAKMAIMGANTVKMNNTVSAATPIDASMFQLNEVLSSVLCIKRQSFITSGTYTPSAGMLYCIIEAWGGGGGGGGAIIVPGASNAGGGGGAGSYSRHLATAADIGISKSVVIGAFGAGGAAGFNAGAAGGNTTLGTSIVIASGGSGGGGGSASVGGLGGGGGLANIGNIIAGSGMNGGNGFAIGNILAYPIGGYGGSTSIGSGAGPVGGPQATSQVGNIGVGYGAGGGGGITFNNGASAAGGNGASGLLVITEFCKQY